MHTTEYWFALDYQHLQLLELSISLMLIISHDGINTHWSEISTAENINNSQMLIVRDINLSKISPFSRNHVDKILLKYIFDVHRMYLMLA